MSTQSFLNIRTLFAVAALSAIVLSAGVFIIAGVHARFRKALLTWAWGIAGQAAGWTLAGLRGQIPAPLSHNLATLLLGLSLGLYYAGVCMLNERPVRWPLLVCVFLGGTLALLYCGHVTSNEGIRNVIASCVGAILLALSGAAAHVNRQHARGFRFLSIVFTIGAGIMVLRASYYLITGRVPASAFAPSWVESLFYLTMYGFALALTFALIITCNGMLVDEMERLAAIDALTQLLNRRSIDRVVRVELERARRTGSSVSILLADIDHFKVVNDTFGHAAGDMALQHVARLIQREVRLGDSTGRYGGEEVLIVLPNTDDEQALLVAERLRTAVAGQVLDAGSRVIRVTLSVGVATSTREESDAESLLWRADAALYRAKAAGRNRVMRASAGVVSGEAPRHQGYPRASDASLRTR